MSLILRQLTAADENAFFEGLKEWPSSDLTWYTFAWKPGVSYSEMLDTLAKEHRGVDLPEGKVPASMLYGFVDGKIIGRVSVRHQLNDYLRYRGGHIGYAVAEKYRGKGYATEMFKQALPFCKQVGIQDLMITCADDNAASWKLIEKFGGRLADKIWDDKDQEMIRRYWIKL